MDKKISTSQYKRFRRSQWENYNVKNVVAAIDGGAHIYQAGFWFSYCWSS